jgi:hypothetical protein
VGIDAEIALDVTFVVCTLDACHDAHGYAKGEDAAEEPGEPIPVEDGPAAREKS